MDVDILTGLIAFSFASSITPGPNNLMLMASGANYGFRRTLPHMLGVGIGFMFMVLVVGLGLIGAFNAIPASRVALKIVSIVYLVYLASKIATASPQAEEAQEAGRPFTFFQAVAFQWVNPKSWTMALTSVAIYAPSQSLLSVLLVVAVFGAINLPCVSLWTMMGEQLRSLLSTPEKLRAFNWAMALLLVGSLYPVLIS